MRTLSTRVTNLTQEVRPMPKVGRTSSNPTARMVGSTQFTSKVVRVYKTVPTTTFYADLTCADVANALTSSTSSAPSVSFRVQGLKVWNMTPAGQTTNYLKVRCQSKLFTSGTTVPLVDDVGTASHLPGVYVNIPNTLTQLQTTSTDSLVAAEVTPFTASGTVSTAQTVVFDVYTVYRS